MTRESLKVSSRNFPPNGEVRATNVSFTHEYAISCTGTSLKILASARLSFTRSPHGSPAARVSHVPISLGCVDYDTHGASSSRVPASVKRTRDDHSLPGQVLARRRASSLPVLGLLGLHDLESVDDLDVGRAGGAVDVSQGLQLETHRDARFPGAGGVHVEGFFKGRGWRRRRRRIVLRRRCGEGGHHEDCADNREFEHLDGNLSNLSAERRREGATPR